MAYINTAAPAAGTSLPFDRIGGTDFPRAKVTFGPEGQAIDASVDSPLPVTMGALPAGTNRSGNITTANTAQQLAAANAARKALYGQNISAGELWINEIGGPAVIGGEGSYRVPAGLDFSISTNRAISIIGATQGQKFTATEL
jgi:hypothetical protein